MTKDCKHENISTHMTMEGGKVKECRTKCDDCGTWLT